MCENAIYNSVVSSLFALLPQRLLLCLIEVYLLGDQYKQNNLKYLDSERFFFGFDILMKSFMQSGHSFESLDLPCTVLHWLPLFNPFNLYCM